MSEQFVNGKFALGFSLSKNAYRIVWKLLKDTALLMQFHRWFLCFLLFFVCWRVADFCNLCVGCEQDLYVLFGINVAILAFAYLFLDRFNHLMNQSKEQNVVHPNAWYPLGMAGKPVNRQADAGNVGVTSKQTTGSGIDDTTSNNV